EPGDARAQDQVVGFDHHRGKELTADPSQSTLLMMRAPTLLLLLVLPAGARADIYSYEDKGGVVHFTNLAPPSGKGALHWKVLYRTGPGRAAFVSGAAPPTTFAGCALSRADVVPATDRSPDRYTRFDEAIAEASE